MTTDLQDPQAAVTAAKSVVDEAEADLVSGKRSISADLLHKITDGWRHADLTAQRVRLAAEEERCGARLKGLEEIGAEVDRLAQPEHTEQLAEAVRDIAAACARFHTVAGAHDADLAELIAAATALRAEPAAPGGPRETSSFIAVMGDTIAHRRVVITPLADHAQAALAHAMSGDVDRAVAEIRTATTAPERKRPDHLLRNVRSGMVVAITGELNDGMKAQLKTSNPRSGDLIELSDHDIEKYMRGEL